MLCRWFENGIKIEMCWPNSIIHSTFNSYLLCNYPESDTMLRVLEALKIIKIEMYAHYTLWCSTSKEGQVHKKYKIDQAGWMRMYFQPFMGRGNVRTGKTPWRTWQLSWILIWDHQYFSISPCLHIFSPPHFFDRNTGYFPNFMRSAIQR